MVPVLSCLLGRMGRCAAFRAVKTAEASRGEENAIAFADSFGLF
jgi:hypothetical protein